MLRLLALCSALLIAPVALAQQAPCVGGVATSGGTAYPCSGVDLMAHLPRSAFTPTTPANNNDIWGWTDPQTGREYALVGLNNGTGFVDVTVPNAPVYLGKLPTATQASLWRDIKVYADHAFVVSEAPGHGIQVFDLTRLRGVTAPQTFTADARYTGLGSAHNIAINEATGFAYAIGATQSGFSCNGGGLHMVNIQNPDAPTFAGCYDGDGYTHDTQCVVYDGPDAGYTGREVCFSSNEDTVTITDVTSKTAPVLISRNFYPSPVYTHQGWLTEDRRHFIVDDEVDSSADGTRTIVMDVADLNDVSFAFFHFGVNPTTDHNQYVRGNYSFQSNYQGGLRILDISGITGGSFVEAAFFDTYPQGNGEGYNGQWSNYPYFASGTVVANDIENGLFVLRPTALVVSAADAPVDAAVGYALSAAVPNPASGGTRLTLSVGAAQAVTAAVFDVTGRRVAVAFAGQAAPGAPVEIAVDTAALPPGVYVVRVAGERFAASRRVVVAR